MRPRIWSSAAGQRELSLSEAGKVWEAQVWGEGREFVSAGVRLRCLLKCTLITRRPVRLLAPRLSPRDWRPREGGQLVRPARHSPRQPAHGGRWPWPSLDDRVKGRGSCRARDGWPPCTAPSVPDQCGRERAQVLCLGAGGGRQTHARARTLHSLTHALVTRGGWKSAPCSEQHQQRIGIEGGGRGAEEVRVSRRLHGVSAPRGSRARRGPGGGREPGWRGDNGRAGRRQRLRLAGPGHWGGSFAFH